MKRNNMRILHSALKQLRVETVLGTYLGRVRDIELDAESHLVVRYIVKKWAKGQEYRIHRNQVVRIEEKRMVVEDVVSRRPLEILANEPLLIPPVIPQVAQDEVGG